jgi:phytoene dehydrogenase-like protein
MSSGDEIVPPSPREDRYDAVVIGGGAGGLVSAALLARAGARVLLAEAFALGGFVHAFRRGAYTFDPSVHQIADPPMFDRLLTHLGVRERVEFLEPPNFYTVALPDFRLHAPFGEEQFVEAHVEALPRQAREVREFFSTCIQIHSEAHELGSRMSLSELDASSDRLSTLMRYRRATVQDVLDEHFSDPLAKAVCGSAHMFFLTPPSELSLQTFAQMVFGHVIHGSTYLRGGMQALVDALAAAIEDNGGEVLVGNRVTGIELENGGVSGIELAGGERVRAPVVISNADALRTYEELVGLEHVPDGELRKLRKLTLSRSLYGLFVATTLDLTGDEAHAILFQNSTDTEKMYCEPPSPIPEGMCLAVPTVVDSSLAPPGGHQLIAMRSVPYDIGRPWPDVKDEFAEATLRTAEGVYPGLRDNLVFAESSTPLAVERFTLNRQGAVFGWAVTPDQIGSRRPNQVTGIGGLYLVGAWTGPGTGFLRAVTGAYFAAQAALTALSSAEVVPRFIS